MTANPSMEHREPAPGKAMAPNETRLRPAISVVVPVYNVLPWLDRCLESLRVQTFRDFETILVDDGSTDGSGERCDHWKRRLPRASVIHQRNGGLANARNTGVAAAAGDWIVFVDSDDFVAPDYLAYLFDLVRKHHVSLAACGTKRTFGESIPENVRVNPCGHGDSEVSSDRTDSLRWLHSQKLTDTMWAKIFRRDLLLAIPQPDGRVHEDTAVIAQIVYVSGRVAVGKRELYGYCVNENSITHSGNPKRLRDQVWAYRDRARFYRSVGEPVFERMAWKQAVGTLWTDAREGYLSVGDARDLWRTSGIRVFDLTSLKCRAFLLFPRTYRLAMRLKRALKRRLRH